MNDRNSIEISGGSFQGSAIGIGHVEHHGVVAQGSVADLRTALAASAPELIGHGRNEEDEAEIRHEIRKIDQELAAPEPDGAAVKTRWKSVLSALGDAATASEQIARITDLVTELFGR
ncbi:hypothetical protein SAMN05660350_02453 [Geodermatophilus obscurus]|uniref:Uncharacterized protein n=1 Tax=Geodermatophilus obscurus TaxID=1861 RepID=A0A1M7U204_9ACTN|nr:hypothetical protein [Geodermatophilus obscurus]SHN76880.1 hypothetical protein SAMN05660350_02453 [Geodermatophilus obscurus]